jgi:hypothetical protein
VGKVDGVFFGQIDTVLAVIGNNGNLCLQFQNLWIFVTTSSHLNCGLLIILTRSSYALVAKKKKNNYNKC